MNLAKGLAVMAVFVLFIYIAGVYGVLEVDISGRGNNTYNVNPVYNTYIGIQNGTDASFKKINATALNVTQDINVEDDIRVKDDIIVDGQVGIGILNPIATSKLHVYGGDLTVSNNEWQKFLNSSNLDDGTGFYRTTSNAFFQRTKGNSYIIHQVDDKDIRYWGADNKMNYNFRFTSGALNDWNAESKRIDFRYKGQATPNLFYIQTRSSNESVVIGNDLHVSGIIYYNGGMLGNSSSLLGDSLNEMSVKKGYENLADNSQFDVIVSGDFSGNIDTVYYINITKIDSALMYNGIGCRDINNTDYCVYFRWSDDKLHWSSEEKTTPAFYLMNNNVRFGFRCELADSCAFAAGEQFNFTAIASPAYNFKVDNKNSQLLSEVNIFNITRSLFLNNNNVTEKLDSIIKNNTDVSLKKLNVTALNANGMANLSLDDEVYITDGSTYFKFYDYNDAGVPLIKGYAGATSDSRFLMEDISGVIGIGTTEPKFGFIDSTLSEDSYIRFDTTNDILNFTDAEGGYWFDDKVTIPELRLNTNADNYLLETGSGTNGRAVNLSGALYVNDSSGTVSIGTTGALNNPLAVALYINGSLGQYKTISSSDYWSIAPGVVSLALGRILDTTITEQTGDMFTWVWGDRIISTADTNSDLSSTYIWGMSATTEVESNAILGAGYGVLGEVYTLDSTANITTGYGVAGDIDVADGGNITTGYAFYGGATTDSGGWISTYYDAYFADSDDAYIGTHYGLYQADSGAVNYFNGDVGIGTTTPSYSLEADGIIDAQGFSTNSTTGYSGTISVRKGDDSGACNLVFSGGILTSTTC